MSEEPPPFSPDSHQDQPNISAEIPHSGSDSGLDSGEYQQPQDIGLAPQGLYGGGHVKTNSLAVWSLVTGLMFCLMLICCIPITPILAIVFGHIAISQINASNGSETGKGMAIAGLVLGYAQILLLLLYFIFVGFGVFMPSLLNIDDLEENTVEISELSENTKEIHRSLVQYSFDHDDTLPGTEDEKETSNDCFRELFSKGYMIDEYPFYSEAVKGAHKPDEIIEGEKALEKGENVFGYIKGVSIIHDPADTPILIAPVRMVKGIVEIDTDAFGGNFIICMSDGRIVTLHTYSAHLAEDEYGDVIFSAGRVYVTDKEGLKVTMEVTAPDLN